MLIKISRVDSSYHSLDMLFFSFKKKNLHLRWGVKKEEERKCMAMQVEIRVETG
jgi:hypothetical protein